MGMLGRLHFLVCQTVGFFFHIRYACVQLQAIERKGVDCGELFAGEKSQKCPRNRGTFFGTVEFWAQNPGSKAPKLRRTEGPRLKRQKGETYISSPDFLDVQAYVDTVCMHVKTTDARKLMHFPEKPQNWLF